MNSVVVPTTVSTLRSVLDDLELTITSRKWERAAMVYAFTDIGGPRNTAYHSPPPPKMNIRTFAAQGFLGLSTPKSVSRYREAWITAINEGWAVPVNPGDKVDLPAEPFPPWPYGQDSTWEDATVPEARTRVTRPFGERVLSRLEGTALSLRQLAAYDSAELDEDTRRELRKSLAILRDQAAEALAALEGVSV